MYIYIYIYTHTFVYVYTNTHTCWPTYCAATRSRPPRCGKEPALAPCRASWGRSLTASRADRTSPPCQGRTRQGRAAATIA